MEIKKDNLEEALNKKDEDNKPKVSKDMEIGFHQGALTTLLNERNEMVRMIQQIESVMQAHMKRLEEMGVKIKVGKSEEKK
ncbi:hypothetical protein A3K82_01965 [Candidatus Pacearchaeota archaeon RBG_19FT_COMBO_34_9]|nr:MAG: hypothetical protein A3K82_01965 [Candidatus Pacearchaeota archaeon RBG_19FT_COMBO_34_9]OGJ16745.1 MAG: hypothetical protein A3K74_00835 [Candidatus Pacearchaeota archaeon RBG_13_33_26]